MMLQASREILFIWSLTGGLSCCCLVACCILDILCILDKCRPTIFRNLEYLDSNSGNYQLSAPLSSQRPPPPKYNSGQGTVLHQPPPAYTTRREQ